MPPTAYPQQKRLTAAEIASSQGISPPKLSRDATYVVYSTGPKYKANDYRTAALWVAQTGQEGTPRKATSGTFHDIAPVFHPVSSEIYFLSDRPKAGGLLQIFKIPLQATEEDEPVSVVTLEERHGVNIFAISPDGNYLAFIQQHRPAHAKEPVWVWREKKDLGLLSLVDLRDSTTSVKTLVSVDAHVEYITWKPDSSAILYRLHDRPDSESRCFPVRESIVSIKTGEISGEFEYPVAPGSPAVWLEDDSIVFIQAKSVPELCSSNALWVRSADGSPARHVASGIEDDVEAIISLESKNLYAVAIAVGVDTQIDVYSGDTKLFIAWKSGDVGTWAGYWDMRAIEDGRFVFAAVTSSAVTGSPEQLWCGSAEQGSPILLENKLHTPNEWFTSAKAPVTQVLEYKSSDGETIQAVYSYPRGADLSKMPTVIVPHGGPYGRETHLIWLTMTGWNIYLATHGYLTVSPNYRGSSGRGDTFAQAASGGMGTLEWIDIEALISDLVQRGWADPKRLAIAGYSQGGFLAAWGCTRPGNRFKAAVVGTGVTDWGMLAATSDAPDLEAALGGGAPWVPGEPGWLKGSPIKDACNVTAPVLLLHGGNDQHVPLSQAVALLRGIERVGKAAVKPELVVYPREGHMFEEQQHVKDMLERVLAHVDKYL